LGRSATVKKKLFEMHGIDDAKISDFRIESVLRVRILTEAYERQNQ